ncbi:hypothetical protein HMN09_01319600 [Mycena chlorophos]|uniref:Proteophosphoglycan 5 n=1 Tax=Mycena chlorophos TaxID=658473 RepID=A0A8H6VRR2_MYCCL|nr:hypothetical protein HMN09_01319600 [Mycena chlorophos]
MDNSLRARYRIPAPKSPSRQRSPVKPARRRRCSCGFRHLFGGLKLFLFALLSLAVLFTQFPATDDPTTSLPSRTALSRVIPSVLRLPQMRAQAPPRKMPLVDRSVLQRLAALEIFPDPDERPYFSPDDTLTRMPLVTRIPETSTSSKRSTPLPPHLDCGASPCRFLLPLRVAEQESNARLHLAQIMHLAHELDRTLVLPNVGKNHIGACFKWPFDAYYDPAQYNNQTLRSGAPTVVSMEVFRHWLDTNGATTNPTGRSVVLSSKLPESRFTPTAFSTLPISPGGDPEADFPSCFATKFDSLNVFEHTPIHVFPTEEYPGPEIQELLSATNPFDEEEDEGDPTVILLTYDYRHELFPSTILPRYSPALHGLAARVAPSEPYVAVHWRTESGSVSSDTLVGCVESLVHVICKLQDAHPGLRVVWLASDLPRHSEARILLERAFAEEEKLVGLQLTELTEAELSRAHANAGLGLDPGFLRDTGLRGILEKLVASRARVFVTGGMGCARRSSFTQQIIDARRELDSETVVEYFTAELV